MVTARHSARASATLVAAARTLHAIFFLVTATYCLLTYSPFAYQQLIRPHLISGLGSFVAWHHIGYWLIFLITLLSMLGELRSGRSRITGWSYLAVSAAVGVTLLIKPVLPQVENDGRGLALALLALLPPIWLAVYDHNAVAGAVRPEAGCASRILRSAVLAGVVVWLWQTAAMPWRLEYTGEILMTRPAIVLGLVTSLIVHLVLFISLGLVLIAGMRVASAAGSGYAGLLVVSAVAGAFVIKRFVFGAISFQGFWAWLLALEVGAAAALLWSSVARRFAAAAPQTPAATVSVFDVWWSPLPGGRSRSASLGALLALGIGSYVLLARVMTFDWDFVVQKLCVVAFWMLAIGYAHGVLSDRRRPARAFARVDVVAAPLAAFALFGASVFAQPRLPRWIGEPGFVPEFVLQGYVAADPSFRVIRDLLHVNSREDAAFYGFLRTHSNIAADVAPIDLAFVPSLGPSERRPPHVFLLVLDSLRPDYLSPYNPAVEFTPSIARFAGESVVFERAFSRYGGTGLSMPAMWTGGMVLHKQYISPYHPMSTLHKLLEADRYQSVLTPDHITVQMIPAGAAYTELEGGRPEMQYRFCRTLDEMSSKLPDATRGGPIFGHTRALDLHVGNVPRFPVPAGATYPGFVPYVAAAVEHIDACFGRFVESLKRQGLYENSLIILTADHGDSLGERRRWGHAIHLFPEVLRIPLIVHVPDSMRESYTANPAAVSFLSDVTPTLYELTGRPPADLGPLFGKPLFTRKGGAPRQVTDGDAHLVGSSYGAVYGVLRDNGRTLYIADAINGHEYRYELSRTDSARVGMTEEQRQMDRSFIANRLRELAALYHYEPAP
jgi:hypothetical protein